MTRFQKGVVPLSQNCGGRIRELQDNLENCENPKGHDVIRSFQSSKLLKETHKEDILDVVGGDGPWQRRIFWVMLVAVTPGAWHNLSMTFLTPDIDHWCAKTTIAANVSLKEWRNYGLPPDPGRKKCYRYENWNVSISSEDGGDMTNIKTVACDTWDYDLSFYTSTLLTKWNLVCDQEWLVSLSKSVFMFGILVGVSVLGCVSDKFGRRPTITASCYLMVLSAILCAFSVDFSMFIFARFFVAVGYGGYYTVLFVLLMEMCEPKIRTVYGLVVQIGWCIGFVSLPLMAYLIKDSFWIQIAITLPCIPLLGIGWIIPESPRWLLSQGRLVEALKVLKKAAEINKIKNVNLNSQLSKIIEDATEVHMSGETEGNVIDLLITPGLRKITLNVYFLWFVVAFVYYGLSFNTNDLDGDPFINFALSGAVEFPANFISIFIVKYWGRRRPLAATLVTAGLSCLLAYPLPEDPGWPTVLVSMIGKYCITSAFGIVYIYTTEIFPTVVRNAGLGSASLCECIGSMIAPFLKELSDATHPVFPLLLIGAMSFVSGLMVLLLPETHNFAVPNTLKEAVTATRRKKTKLLKNTVGIALQEIPLSDDVATAPLQSSNLT